MFFGRGDLGNYSIECFRDSLWSNVLKNQGVEYFISSSHIVKLNRIHSLLHGKLSPKSENKMEEFQIQLKPGFAKVDCDQR